ncbi:hypothetical protein [Rhodococcus sp. NPDC057529]
MDATDHASATTGGSDKAATAGITDRRVLGERLGNHSSSMRSDRLPTQ